jgi:hypothetical protein
MFRLGRFSSPSCRLFSVVLLLQERWLGEIDANFLDTGLSGFDISDILTQTDLTAAAQFYGD